MNSNTKSNLERCKRYLKKRFEKTSQDQRAFLYIERFSAPTPAHDFIESDQYYHGYGQSIPEQDVYAEVFYGTGGYPEPPVFDIEWFQEEVSNA